MWYRFLPSLVACTITLLVPEPARAQECEPQWAPVMAVGFDRERVFEAVAWTNLGGPAVIVKRSGLDHLWDGATFEEISNPGGTFPELLGAFDVGFGREAIFGDQDHLFRHDAADFVQIAPTPPNMSSVQEFISLDFGDGPRLHAWYGSNSTRVFDGIAWVSLIPTIPSDTRHILMFDDGSGSAPYIAGELGTDQGQPVDAVLRWNGAGWDQVGNVPDDIRDIAVLGSGEDATLGVISRYGSARLVDGAWELMEGLDEATTTSGLRTAWFDQVEYHIAFGGLTIVDENEQIIGGGLAFLDGDRCRRFPPGSTIDSPRDVSDFAILQQDGPDRLLVWDTYRIAFGPLATAPVTGNNRLLGHGQYAVQWHNGSWSPTTHGLDMNRYFNLSFMKEINASTQYHGPNGPELVVGGSITAYGPEGNAYNVARWDGNAWRPMGYEPDWIFHRFLAHRFAGDSSDTIYSLSSSHVVSLGLMTSRVAVWTGHQWESMAQVAHPNHRSGAPGLRDIEIIPTPSGERLVVAGSFNAIGGSSADHVALWDGEQWQPVGNNTIGGVNSLEFTDIGEGFGLYAGNWSGVWQWRSGDWEQVGDFDAATDTQDYFVYDLHTFDDGGGNRLYAGGFFRMNLAGRSVHHAAVFDGDLWKPVATANSFLFGVGPVNQFITLDEGSGPALYAAGPMSIRAVDGFGQALGRWDGTEWTLVGGGLSRKFLPFAYATTLAPLTSDFLDRPALFVGGDFGGVGRLGTPMPGMEHNGAAVWLGCELPALCPGDIADDFGTLGADGMVGFGDFMAMLDLIGTCPGMTPGCDGDIADDFGTLPPLGGADGMVSFGDFLALLGLVGPCP